MTPIELNTERLRLRQWKASDREPYAKLSADPRVREYFPTVLDRNASDATVNQMESCIAERGWGFWAVELKASGELIGDVGLNIPNAELPCSPCVEIGWLLAFEHWGKGYAVEAAQAALRVGFEQLDLLEIVAFTAINNGRSRRVMENLYMIEDTAAVFEHPQVPEGSPLRSHCLYRLTRHRWIESAKWGM